MHVDKGFRVKIIDTRGFSGVLIAIVCSSVLKYLQRFRSTEGEFKACWSSWLMALVNFLLEFLSLPFESRQEATEFRLIELGVVETFFLPVSLLSVDHALRLEDFMSTSSTDEIQRWWVGWYQRFVFKWARFFKTCSKIFTSVVPFRNMNLLVKLMVLVNLLVELMVLVNVLVELMNLVILIEIVEL